MQELVSKLSLAARDRRRISGLTHNFYRYPARFSPTFAATAIECFSETGDLILDPYMGGGTTIVEAILDRLVHNAYRLTLKGESMRKQRTVESKMATTSKDR